MPAYPIHIPDTEMTVLGDVKGNPASTSSEPFIEARNITKRFGSLVALDRVSLALHPGRIHAILGENGAGKSTLCKILYGVYTPDGGTLVIDGNERTWRSPAEALRAGVRMVFQDFRLVPELTVLENVALFNRGGSRQNARRLRADLLHLAERYGLVVGPDAPVWQLDLAQRQQMEILKALVARYTRLLILDEPTSVLAPHQVASFLALLRRLAEDGYAIALITHKMREVMQCADEITVLRHGHVVLHAEPGAQELRFFGRCADEYRRAWQGFRERVGSLGVETEEVDMAVLEEAGGLLYDGPWIAERWSDLGPFVESHPDATLPVTHSILRSGEDGRWSAAQLFSAMHRLRVLQREVTALLHDRVLLLPTVGGKWTRAEVAEDPVATNAMLGTYTNHCNLLDLAALAVPVATTESGLPFGVTAFALSHQEDLLFGVGTLLA